MKYACFEFLPSRNDFDNLIRFIFLMLLYVTGESIISPGARQGLIPLAIPLSKSSSGMSLGHRVKYFDNFSSSALFLIIFLTGNVTALLRWPTAPPE